MNKRKRLLWEWGGGSTAAVVLLGAGIAAMSREDRSLVQSAGVGVEGVTSVLSRSAGGADLPIRFDDVSADSGIDFHHFPALRESLLPEDMGSGVAIGDYDDDGRADVFLVNFAGSVFPGAAMDAGRGRSRLYRNLGGLRFADVTEESGIEFAGYGAGAAWGDYDGDGDLDLYIAAYGANVLYQNQGDGKFQDVTEATGTQDGRYSACASWADYDRDGDLDLYVGNYVDFAFRAADRGVTIRSSVTEEPYTLNPNSYPAQPNSLFRNRGDGTFEEVAREAGVANPTGKSLSASWADLDNDGWPDLYVANDVSDNGVFRNRGDGTFEDIGASSLAADYRSAMGLAVADFDNDLDHDVFITHWLAQENALYRNMIEARSGTGATGERLWFMDVADDVGLGQIALDMVGWATGFCDFDNDSRRDLWVVNGSTLEDPRDPRKLRPQNAFLFWNRGERGFVEVAERACGRLAAPLVGRGGAQADLDGDGRVDLVWNVHSADALVLRNVSEPTGHWVGVRLRQQNGNTHALGGRVYAKVGKTTYFGEVGASSSYLSQDEEIVHLGFGAGGVIDELRIVWPDGTQERHGNVAVDQLHTFTHRARYPVSAGAPPQATN